MCQPKDLYALLYSRHSFCNSDWQLHRCPQTSLFGPASQTEKDLAEQVLLQIQFEYDEQQLILRVGITTNVRDIVNVLRAAQVQARRNFDHLRAE
jgi:hypothetical protein